MTEQIDIADPTRPLAWLAHCPVHATTPLHDLPTLAAELGWAVVHVKDETLRMGMGPQGEKNGGMGSFKALGGAYAVASVLVETFGVAAAELASLGRRAARVTFATASAGNHGLSVAAGALAFGAHAVVYLAENVPEGFAERLRAKGARVVRAGAVYEDAMAAAMRDADANGWHLVSDSSWEGYTQVPSRVMQGYVVMGDEMRASFETSGDWPTHVALQAGVGGMAAALAAHIRAHWAVQPHIIVVEPNEAPCLKASVAAGHPVRVEGGVSAQGRLDCKDPSVVAFELLREVADAFVTVTDDEAREAVDLLTRHGIATTPSGAAGLAGLIASDLPTDARALVIATEGTA